MGIVMSVCMRSLLAFVLIILSPILHHTHVSPMCSQTSISLEYSLDAPIDNPKIYDSNVDLGYAGKMFNMLVENVDNFLSLGYFSGYNASFDPYCMYLVDKPRKIIWNTFFAFSFDFFIGFALVKRALTFFAVIIFMPSYYQAWKLCAEEFDKLLRALTMLDLKGRALKLCWSG